MNDFVYANPFCYSTRFAGKRLHLGITGSVACYKAIELMRGWLGIDIGVSATLSKGATHFITPLLLSSLGADPVYGEMFHDDDNFAHLEPGRSADCMAIVPASANCIAKMATGLADDMLACQYIAYNGPVVLAPAMNFRMWRHSATCANVETLRERGVRFIGPASGKMACGEEGAGRLENPLEIFLGVLGALAPADMDGINVLVTSGPTREYWDGVRFWSNPSSGRMGAALATAAWLRGAKVTVICGPGNDIYFPRDIIIVPVTSAAQMHKEAENIWPSMDMGLFCAAVADFAPIRPEYGSNGKVHKNSLDGTLRIEYTRNPDILATLAGKRAKHQKILGFAAEIATDMDELAKAVQDKLQRKKADLLAGNLVNMDNGAFGARNASMLVTDRHGVTERWMPKSKADIAWDLLTWLLKL